MFKICFYVPENYADVVKNAMFTAGAGTLGNYSCVSWQTLGEGQYMPMEGSKPFTGDQLNLQKVPEYKVEIVCTDDLLKPVIAALKKSHPYEEPVYQAIKIETI
jgi:structural toxin protein (hemagglutinin/hemolysin) RtxA